MLYIIFFIVVSFFLFQDNGKYRSNVRFLAVILFLLALIVGMGDMLGGYDRYSYCQLFDITADTIRDGSNPFGVENPLMGYANEMSYVVLNVIIAHVTANRYIFVLLLTLTAYILVFISIKRHFTNYPLTMVLFMGLYFFFSFTYLRQLMATCFTWIAFKYVIERKLIPFLLCTFVAYKFHNSAVIFLPIYFVPIKKFSKRTVLVVLTILLLIGSTGLPSSLYAVYGDASGTDARTAQYVEYGNSFRIEYVLEVLVFLYLIMKRYDRIPHKTENIVFLNASLIFFAVLLFFVTSSSAGRQSWYYMIGLIYTLVSLVSTERKRDGYALTVYAIAAVLFLRIVTSWGILVSPYKTFLTEGHRIGDQIYDRYEYDDAYDRDKFYRKVIDFAGFECYE